MNWVLLFAAGIAGGLTGSIAGLASVATYPALLVVGLSPVAANVTNTVALVFNGIGSVWGSRPELAGQGASIRRILPVAALGGAAGAALLLSTPAEGFEKIVPILLGLSALAILLPRKTSQRARVASHHTTYHEGAAGVRGDLPDLCLRRLFRCRGGRTASRAVVGRRTARRSRTPTRPRTSSSASRTSLPQCCSRCSHR